MKLAFSFKLQKLNFGWAFLFFFFVCSSSVQASFYEEHVAPVQSRAFDSTSRHILAAGIGSNLLAQSVDSEAREQWGSHRTMPEPTAEYGNRFGTYAIGPLIALGQYYFDRDNGLSHIRALSYTGIVTTVLKESIGRRRPDGSNHRSMPSGHSSSAFTTATALTYAYGWKMGMVAYPAATFVALSRMADDVHWFSDVVTGAFIGVWLGRASFYASIEAPRADQASWNFIPVLSAYHQGLQISYEF